MSADMFFGRKEELSILNRLLKKKTASLVVIRGRRRVGKSRLAKEFAGKERFIKLVGLAPEKNISAQDQREHFASEVARQCGLAVVNASDWSNLFLQLAQASESGRVFILLDEISWMAEGDSTFLPKLKTFWDEHFSQNPKLIMMLCSSVSIWIEENIVSSTAFVGRLSQKLTLRELPLMDAVKFWGNKIQKVSKYELFKIFAITGGIPRYLEEIIFSSSAEDNIKALCFNPGGVLVDEFDEIFNDSFQKNSKYYKQILYQLSSGRKTLLQISEALEIPRNGRLTEYISALEMGGFIRADFTWNIKEDSFSDTRAYRLSDNYTRFYLHYIEKRKQKIEQESFRYQSLEALPGWEGILGLQFENLVLNNRKFIFESLGINPENIQIDNPYFQQKTKRHEACQIDYLIQTRKQTLYVCEIKFSKKPIGVKVIKEVQQKIERLVKTSNFSIRPVLIHVNGVCEQVVDADYFDEIIDFGGIF